ncbi:MAG: T9SS type A sorting domain-containing protein [Bacteroidetes bacterium]|nr:T9SS type A sorting domain-containing protein [Bacteroidota bacterium]MCW5931881.1 T9SS type A sorting domain-containing protein [Bacteroidota bacterium]
MNNFLNQTINNLDIIREASLKDNLADAKLKNDYVINAQVPEMNSRLINNIEINYAERDNDIQYLIDNFSAILSVAQQCPYAGGNAVIRARVWISMINDSIEYNDNTICLQSGIYRMANDTTGKINYSDIKIIPNPASDKVTVELTGINDGICKVQIRNVLNETVYESEFNCSDKSHLIHINNLSGGVYSITVNAANKKSLISKLIIVK